MTIDLYQSKFTSSTNKFSNGHLNTVWRSQVQQMPNRGKGMAEQHPRPGVAHHLADFCPLCRGVAMYWALLTRGFCVAEFAGVEPPVRIDQQPGTIDAQLPIVLFAAAIE